MFYKNLNIKKEKYQPTTLTIEMDWSNLLEWEISLCFNQLSTAITRFGSIAQSLSETSSVVVASCCLLLNSAVVLCVLGGVGDFLLALKKLSARNGVNNYK